MNLLYQGRHKSRPGFTIFELLIVISIIAMLLAMLSPMLFKPRPSIARQELLDKLSALVMDGYIGALEQGTLHRIVFDLEKKEVRLESETGKTETDGKQVFAAVSGNYSVSLIDWPENLEIKNLFINGNDEMLQRAGATTNKIWFYLTPDGMAQEMTLNARDINDIDLEGRQAEFSIVLNPFSMQLESYAVFQKP